MRVKMNVVVLIVVLLVSAGIGFVLGQKGIPGITGNAIQKNCIPQKDFLYFLNKSNDLKAEYDKCVSDLWSLQFAIKTGGKIAAPGYKQANATK